MKVVPRQSSEKRLSRRSPQKVDDNIESALSRLAREIVDVSDRRPLDAWGDLAGMSRRTFMRAFSSDVGMPFGRWRQQARLFAALEMFAEGSSVTDAAIAVGYDSVSAFIDMFRTMLGSTPLTYLRSTSAGSTAKTYGYRYQNNSGSKPHDEN